MSEHAQSSSHDEHHSDSHGHDEHAADGHNEHWGDYNAQPPAPSTLPAVSPWALVVFGLALASLLTFIIISSFKLAVARHEAVPPEHAPAAHSEEH